MGRKVFISFLGASKYVETYYLIENQKSEYVTFVQEALTDFYCKDWPENSKIYIFLTKTAKANNWDDTKNIGLGTTLSKKSYAEFVETCSIPEGFSEDEIWEIFDIVFNKIQDNDEIYFDVTHAFRSIPMFSSVLFHYSQFMKNTTLVKVSYGAFEKLGPSHLVRQMPPELRVAPVIDLSNIIALQEYTEMANSLVSFGRFGKISDVLTKSGENSLIIKDLSGAIEKLDNYIATNRLSNIEDGKVINRIKGDIKALKKIKINNATKNVIKKLESELKDFHSTKTNLNIKAAVEWAKRFNMLPQAYTLGQEFIISLSAEKLKNLGYCAKNIGDKKFRTFVSSLLQISDEDIENRNFKGELAENSELTISLLNLEWVRSIKPHFIVLSNHRNYINHAKADVDYNEFITNFDKYYSCLSILENEA